MPPKSQPAPPKKKKLPIEPKRFTELVVTYQETRNVIVRDVLMRTCVYPLISGMLCRHHFAFIEREDAIQEGARQCFEKLDCFDMNRKSNHAQASKDPYGRAFSFFCMIAMNVCRGLYRSGKASAKSRRKVIKSHIQDFFVENKILRRPNRFQDESGDDMIVEMDFEDAIDPEELVNLLSQQLEDETHRERQEEEKERLQGKKKVELKQKVQSKSKRQEAKGKRRPIVKNSNEVEFQLPHFDPLEFKELADRFRDKSEYHELVIEKLLIDPDVLTDSGRINKTKLCEATGLRTKHIEEIIDEMKEHFLEHE